MKSSTGVNSPHERSGHIRADVTDCDDRAAFGRQYMLRLCKVMSELPLDDLAQVLAVLERALAERRQVFLAGNGGSAATASHMASDLVRGVAGAGGPGFRAVALSDNVPLITAIANDEDYKEVFSSQLAALAQPGDLLIVVSGSGNSANIVRALEVARQMQLTTVGLLGMGGGKAAGLVDVSIIVPSDDYGLIESIHLVFDHLITDYLRSRSGDVARAGRK